MDITFALIFMLLAGIYFDKYKVNKSKLELSSVVILYALTAIYLCKYALTLFS